MQVDNNEIVVSFGYWVRRQRKALDLTQAALAWRVGCAPVTIKKIERDERRPSRQMAERLADQLNIPAGERDHFIRKARGEYVAVTISPATTIEVGVVRHNLPSQPTPFIGREEELADITRRLIDPVCRLLALIGPGGIGKTRLALQAAQDLVNIPSAGAIFANGIFFVPLTPINSLGGLISAIAKAVNFNFYSDISPRQQLLDYLRGKAILLVLDNFEHLLSPAHGEISGEGPSTESHSAEKFVAEILSIAPGVKILVSSREALHLHEAWFHPVDGMQFPGEGVGEDQDLDEYDAIQLFVQSARRVRIGFSAEVERQSVVRICQLVEGNPLAIEMAAAWLKLLPCDRIATEIERNLGFLTAQYANTPERHRSMRAVFEHSWQLLTEAERDVLKKLTVFQGGFRQGAAEYVAGASLTILRTLVEKSLLRPTDTGRYQMHELLRQFAGDKLQVDSTEMTATQERHSRHYLAFLQAREKSLQGEQRQAVLFEIDKEIGNVRVGWNWAVDQGQVGVIDQVLPNLFNFFQARSQYQEGEETFGYAADHLRQLDVVASERKFRMVQAKILARRDVFYGFLGLTEPAKDHLQSSLTIAREFGHQVEIAFCLNYLGQFAGWQGQYTEAVRLIQESLAISKAIGDQENMAITLHNLAEVAQFLGENEKAKRLAHESLAISRKLDRQDWIAYALDRLGFSTFILGHYLEAEQHYQESLTIFEEIGDQLGMSLVLGGLGLVAWGIGGDRLLEAEILGQKSLAIARECGHRFHIATRLGILGQIVNGAGQPEQAQQFYLEGLKISRSINAAVPMIICLSGLGDVNRQLGDLQASRNYLFEALKTSLNARLLAYTSEAVVYYAALLDQESDAIEQREPARQQNRVKAMELVTLVRQHPACWQVYKDVATRLQAKLGEELPPEIAVTARARGRNRPLADAVKGLRQWNG